MNETDPIITLLGIFMIYAIIHFFVFQFKKTWQQRSTYEKTLTIISMVSIALIFVGLSDS